MIVTKLYDGEHFKETPGTHDLDTIRKYAPDPESVTHEDVFIGRVKLANDQYDRVHERFTKEILDRFAETLPGKPVLRGHNTKQEPAGRFFDAEVIKDRQGVNHVVARYYLAASDPLTAKVKTGIAKEVSLGGVGHLRFCDICSKDFDKDCTHLPGREYDGKVCRLTYGGDIGKYEAREGSFVVNACQPGAETIKSADTAEGLTLLKMAALDAAPTSTSYATDNADGTGKEPRMDPTQAPAPEPDVTKAAPDELQILKSWKTEHEPLVADGIAYRARLKAEITRLAGITKTDEFAALILKTADSAAIADLEAIEKSLLAKMNEMFPPSGHGTPAAPQADLPPAAPEPFSPFRRNRFAQRG